MINKQALNRIIDLAERGQPLLAGEVAILREAVDLLDDLASTVDKIVAGSKITDLADRRFAAETTQELKIIAQLGDDDHRGCRP